MADTPLGLARAPRATFAQLRTFEAVAALGSVTSAAQRLHLSQPTVSTQLKELAAGLDTRLFVPAGRGIQLTDTGRALLECVRHMFGHWQAFEESVQAIAGLQRGVLRIAGVTTTEYFIAQLLQPFARAYPGVQIDLAVENRAAVVERLQREQDDLAVMMMPPTDMPLQQMPILDNPLVVIGPAGHPWSQSRTKRPIRQLIEQGLLMREAGSGTRAAAMDHLASLGHQPRIHMSLGSNEALKHAVAAGLGLAVISRHALAQEPAADGVAVLPVSGFPIRRQWQLVWRSDRHLPLAAATFVAQAKAQALG
jgi:LysR family transcriptional regulator, low CO2-responsive transcriptional regulator